MKEKKVLIIDDEREIADIVAMALESEGYQTEACYDSREALVLAKKWNPNLIISDVMMPDVSGPEVVEELDKDELMNGTPVIFISAMGPEGMNKLRKRFDARENTGFINKPFDLDTIVDLAEKFRGRQLTT